MRIRGAFGHLAADKHRTLGADFLSKSRRHRASDHAPLVVVDQGDKLDDTRRLLARGIGSESLSLARRASTTSTSSAKAASTAETALEKAFQSPLHPITEVSLAHRVIPRAGTRL
jgi:hypothetical protein